MRISLKRFKNKKIKGSILDLVFLAGFLLVVGMTLIVSSFVMGTIKDNFFTVNNTNNQTASYYATSFNTFNSTFDNLFIVIFALSGILLVVSAFFIRSSPIFSILFIISLIAVIFLAIVSTKIYKLVAEQDFLNDTVQNFAKTNYVMSHLSIFIGVLAVLVLIALLINTGGGEY